MNRKNIFHHESETLIMLTFDTEFKNREAIIEENTISTAKAAKMLGLSTTMLQKLVDQNIFKAWKTPGGHRRIDVKSVLNYQANLKSDPISSTNYIDLPVIKLIFDEDILTEELINEVKKWSDHFDISFWNSVPDAFLSFSTRLPDILVIQLTTSVDHQRSMLIALDKFIHANDKSMTVLFSSESLSGIDFAGMKLNSNIKFCKISFTREWLSIFLLGAFSVIKLN